MEIVFRDRDVSLRAGELCVVRGVSSTSLGPRPNVMH